MKTVSFPETKVPADLRSQVMALQELEWPSGDPPGSPPGHDPALRPISVLLLEGDEVVSALDILSKVIAHAGQTWAASGLSAVVSAPAHRGKGYGRRLVEEATRMMETSGADLGIFTCDRPLQGFYEGAGWTWLPGTALIGGTPEAPFPSDQLDKVTLGSFFSPRARAAANEFVGARIELYPGYIDRLW